MSLIPFASRAGRGRRPSLAWTRILPAVAILLVGAAGVRAANESKQSWIDENKAGLSTEGERLGNLLREAVAGLRGISRDLTEAYVDYRV